MFFDTSAWVELFKGSTQGERVKKYITSEVCFTSALSLAEITSWALRNKKDADYYLSIVREGTTITELSQKLFETAGKVHAQHKKAQPNFGMIDAILYVSAQKENETLLTTDHHFQGLKNVEMLEVS